METPKSHSKESGESSPDEDFDLSPAIKSDRDQVDLVNGKGGSTIGNNDPMLGKK